MVYRLFDLIYFAHIKSYFSTIIFLSLLNYSRARGLLETLTSFLLKLLVEIIF